MSIIELIICAIIFLVVYTITLMFIFWCFYKLWERWFTGRQSWIEKKLKLERYL